MDSESNRTLWCGNLSSRVTEALLYELFLQAGPLERVTMPRDSKTGAQRSYAFILFEHTESVSYAVDLFATTSLFGRQMCLQNQATRNQGGKRSSAGDTDETHAARRAGGRRAHGEQAERADAGKQFRGYRNRPATEDTCEVARRHEPHSRHPPVVPPEFAQYGPPLMPLPHMNSPHDMYMPWSQPPPMLHPHPGYRPHPYGYPLAQQQYVEDECCYLQESEDFRTRPADRATSRRHQSQHRGDRYSSSSVHHSVRSHHVRFY